MPACPICRVASSTKRDGTPYFTCANCQTWWQDPLPPKIWHGSHETWLNEPMSDGEKAANKGLAEWLFGKMGNLPGFTLDIGCGYPILLHYLKQHGCAVLGIDGDGLPNDLGVTVIHDDFETIDPDKIAAKQRLIIFCHTFEHIYNPVAVFKKLHTLLDKDGSLFIRMPDHQVNGYERDLTEGHFSIHPFYYCFASILELCYQSGLFTVDWTGELQPGQRDILLKPR